MIIFNSDKVRVKTGKADDSATVEFEVGEYQLENIKELIGIVKMNMKITVDIIE
jgi:hypothetical protein